MSGSFKELSSNPHYPLQPMCFIGHPICLCEFSLSNGINVSCNVKELEEEDGGMKQGSEMVQSKENTGGDLDLVQGRITANTPC